MFSFITTKFVTTRINARKAVRKQVSKLKAGIIEWLLEDAGAQEQLTTAVKVAVDDATEELESQAGRAVEEAVDGYDFSCVDFDRPLEEWSQSRDGQRALTTLVEEAAKEVDLSDMFNGKEDDIVEAALNVITNECDGRELAAKILRTIADSLEN